MDIAPTLNARRAIATLLSLAAAAAPAWAQLVADPPKLNFTAPTQSFTVHLSNGGAPLAANDIKGWKFMAGDSNYAHMMTLTAVAGGFTLTPTDTVEVGSYDLQVETTHGPIAVAVATPLSDVPDVVQEAGWTTDAQRRAVEVKMGVASQGARAEASFELPPNYYVGQTLTLQAPPSDGHSYTWTVNGVVVAEGMDQSTLHYTFPKPGEYVVNFVETATKDSGTYTVSRAESQTLVLAVPTTPVQAKVGTVVRFSSLPGYGTYAWSVDGKPMSTDAALDHAFTTPGVHTVE